MRHLRAGPRRGARRRTACARRALLQCLLRPAPRIRPLSFHFYLYRARAGLGPFNTWTEMHAEPLGTLEEVRARLAALYPQVRWTPDDKSCGGLGPNRPGQLDAPYLDLRLREDEAGVCRMVMLNKAAPSVMRRILEAMNLNYVCAPEAGELVDVYAYTDEDRYYAKKAWP